MFTIITALAGVKKLKATVCEFNALLRLSISEKGRKGIEQKTILTTKEVL